MRSELLVVYSTEEFQKPNVHDVLIYLKTTSNRIDSLILTIPTTTTILLAYYFNAYTKLKPTLRHCIIVEIEVSI
jgi:hypothetical protein